MSLLKEIIKEMAITSSTSIASNPSNDGAIRRRDIRGDSSRSEWISASKESSSQRKEDSRKMYVDPKAKENLEKYKKKKPSKLKRFFGLESYQLNEMGDLDDVVSRLKDMEGRATDDKTVTYGVEDDQGNIMKITVKAEQSQDFEERLAIEIQRNANFDDQLSDGEKTTLSRNNPSMAEVLFKLKDEFDIVDVEFPNIPKNAIYRSPNFDIGSEDKMGETDLDNDLGYEDGDFGDDEQLGDLGGAESLEDGMGSLGDDKLGSDLDGGDLEDGNQELGGDLESMEDDDSVEEFGNTPKGGTEDLLQSILQMLKSDAEAKKAQAEAEAEKARALQAEYSAKAAKASIEQQTELLAMEEQIAKQKEKEKESRKLADLAKHRVKQSSGYALESVDVGLKSDYIDNFLIENTMGMQAASSNIGSSTLDLPPPNMLNRLRMIINQKYMVDSNDSPEEKQYKRTARMSEIRELLARIMRSRAAQKFNSDSNKKQQEEQSKQQNQQQQNQNNNPSAQRQNNNSVRPAVAQPRQSNLGSMK
jgi:hypothetical protein